VPCVLHGVKQNKKRRARGTQKVRREAAGSKRPDGHRLQRQGRRVRRSDGGRLRLGAPDERLTGYGGLAAFDAFVRELGLPKELRQRFGELKRGPGVVYPMASQLRLFVDMAVCGAKRVFDLEGLAGDALFCHLSGGHVPSVDVLYDDLRRFDAQALESLEELVSEHGTALAKERKLKEVHVDLDTTVEPLFGTHEGAHPGHNPRYRGRPSYHPLLMRIAETDTVLCARLRPGDTGLGEADIEDVRMGIERVRAALGPDALVTVRVDAGGDCAALMKAIDEAGAFFLIKAKQTPNLLSAVMRVTRWTTLDVDAFGKPTTQVAEVPFRRDDWPEGKGAYRVLAVRTTERKSGKQTCLWEGLDHSVHLLITNDRVHDTEHLARDYDARAGIETLIAELKGGYGIGKVPTSDFEANEALFLLKLLALNLMRRFVQSRAKDLGHALRWRIDWLRRVLITMPGRLLRTGGRWLLRLAPRPMLC